MGFSGFENPTTSNLIAPSATYRDYRETSPQGTFAKSVEPEYKGPDNPRAREIQVSRTHESGAFTSLLRAPRHSLAPPLGYETRGPTPGPSRSTLFDRASRPASVAPGSPPAGIEASGTGDPVNAEGEARDFADPEIPPNFKHAMRELVRRMHSSEFVKNNTLEPIIGSPDANNLMAGLPSELWKNYGAEGRSVYSLFIKADGKDYKCLWCGDVYEDRMQRALGHFRKKHMHHKPFPCRLIHAGGKPWYVCSFLVSDAPYAFGPRSGQPPPVFDVGGLGGPPNEMENTRREEEARMLVVVRSTQCSFNVR